MSAIPIGQINTEKRRQISSTKSIVEYRRLMLKYGAIGGWPLHVGGPSSMTLFDRLREIEFSTRVKLLTCELEIVLCLYNKPNVSAGELFGRSRHSSTSFYATLKRMTHHGLLRATIDQRDRRSNIYALTPEMAAAIKGCLEAGDKPPDQYPD